MEYQYTQDFGNNYFAMGKLIILFPIIILQRVIIKFFLDEDFTNVGIQNRLEKHYGKLAYSLFTVGITFI